ncbi:MAG: FixH family protein [Gammaproteobacteria bacterium]
MINFRYFITYIFGISLFLSCFTLQANEPSWQEFSQSGSLKAKLRPEAEMYQIGQFHNWIITINDESGKPVENAKISIDGGMMGHGHGLPSQPVVTRYLLNGDYSIEGVLFNMSGEWTLNFYIQTPTLKDRVRFDIDISF